MNYWLLLIVVVVVVVIVVVVVSVLKAAISRNRTWYVSVIGWEKRRPDIR